MKKIIHLLFIFFSILLFSQEMQFGESDPSKISDGPYIFRQNKEVFVDYFIDGNAYQKTFSFQELENQNLRIPALNFDQKISFDHESPPDIFKDVNKFFVVSDIHGQHEFFLQILLNNEIIDQNYDWNWQNGHLVILGDVFDRGPQVTEILWLIYKLEQQAESAGGFVHFLLGNHELMIFQNDLRYIHDKYGYVSKSLDRSYSDLFTEKSVLGNWLRSKPTVLKINDYLFTHAGISPVLANITSDSKLINETIRSYVSSRHIEEKNQELVELLIRSNGPFWYRGYFYDSKNYEMISESELDSILTLFESAKIIVGHTTQDSIVSVWNGKIIAVDSGIKYGDKGEGLLWQNSLFYRIQHNADRKRLYE